MQKTVGIYILSSILCYGSLGFEGEYKNNINLYEEIIKENIGKEYLNNNLQIDVKIVESLNIIVNKRAAIDEIYLENNHLEKLVKIEGSAAENTSLKLKEEKVKKVVASCDNSKWRNRNEKGGENDTTTKNNFDILYFKSLSFFCSRGSIYWTGDEGAEEWIL